VSDWLQRTVSWLGKAKVLLWSVATILVCLVALRIFDTSECHFRYLGLGLQCIGILSVLFGINRTREHFNKPSLLAGATTWLKSIPRFRNRERFTLEIADSTHGQSTSRVVLRQHAGPNATIEDRVRVLESNYDSLDSRTQLAQEQIDQANHERREALAAERQERERQVDALTRKLVLTETGGLDLSLMGLLWLILGLVLSTASQELSRLF
jgi:hypothetical protein